jgi:hypothetical protein
MTELKTNTQTKNLYIIPFFIFDFLTQFKIIVDEQSCIS